MAGKLIMAESDAQRRARIMRERIRAAKSRSESPAEDAAVERTVASSTTSDSETATSTTPAAKPPVQPVKPVAKPNFANQWGTSLGPKAQAKTYQKHVLFALVTAFLIQLVASGKSLPTK